MLIDFKVYPTNRPSLLIFAIIILLPRTHNVLSNIQT